MFRVRLETEALSSIILGASVFDGGVREVRVYQSIVDMNDVYKQDTSMPGGARARDQVCFY